jgi:hypothetical protein
MLFAVGDAVWLALFGLIGLVLKEYFDSRRGQRAAQLVEKVKTDLQRDTMAQNAKLETVVEKVEEIHKATNSMKDELVRKTEAEALARGGFEERERAEAKTKGPP